MGTQPTPEKKDMLQDAAAAIYASYYVGLDKNGDVVPEGRNINNAARKEKYGALDDDETPEDYAAEVLSERNLELIATTGTDVKSGAYAIAVKDAESGEIYIASPGFENDGLFSTALTDANDLLVAKMRGGFADDHFSDIQEFVNKVRSNNEGAEIVLVGHGASAQTMQALGVLEDEPVVSIAPVGQNNLANVLSFKASLPDSQWAGLSREQIENRLHDNTTNLFFSTPDETGLSQDAPLTTWAGLGQSLERLTNWSFGDEYYTGENYVLDNAVTGVSIDPNINGVIDGNASFTNISDQLEIIAPQIKGDQSQKLQEAVPESVKNLISYTPQDGLESGSPIIQSGEKPTRYI